MCDVPVAKAIDDFGDVQMHGLEDGHGHLTKAISSEMCQRLLNVSLGGVRDEKDMLCSHCS